MSINSLVWNRFPFSLLKVLALFTAKFRTKEKLGLIRRPWYAYGLLSAADHASRLGLKEIWAIEFGVASGNGLRNLCELSVLISKETGIKIRVAGFDTGSGMPVPTDYRDHPEKYHEGDFPMIDYNNLKIDLKDQAELIIGNISDTVDGFRDKLTVDCPVGFVAIDVDTYSSTKLAFHLFNNQPEFYLPMIYCYFDDCANRSHFNKFCGELFAIDEFNSEHELRKLDVDRGVWNSHRQIGPQLWYERVYILHVFEHTKKRVLKKRSAKIIKEK